jgi:hypothetical protein
MVFLAAVGPAVEAMGGSWRLAVAYFLGGLAGVGAHWAMQSGSANAAPLVGASGAVAACVAVFSVRHFALKAPIAPRLAVPVGALTAVWLLLQVLGGFVRIGDTEAGTAYWAHVGGAAAGLLLALAFRVAKQHQRHSGQIAMEKLEERSPAALAEAARLHLEDHPDDMDAVRSLSDACATLGDRDGEAEAALRMLDGASEQGSEEAIERLVRAESLNRLPSLKRTMLADRLKLTRPDLSLRLLESVVAGPEEDGQRPDALLALAELRREREPEPALDHVRELMRAYPLHPAAELARARGWEI